VSENTSANIWPLDPRKLVKGQILPAEECQRLGGFKASDPYYCFKLLKLREDVEEAARSCNIDIVLRTFHKGLRVLTDDENVNFQPNEFSRAKRLARRSFGRMKQTDVKQLSPANLQKFDRAQIVMAFQVAAMNQTPKSLPGPRKAPDPKRLPPPEEK